jgi:epoxyqueuosine reductase
VQQPGTFPVEYRAALGDRLYGCDDCQGVCPPSVRLGARHRVDLDGAIPEAWVDVIDMLAADDDELIRRHGRWYLADRNPVWWRRNALLVLGNTGDPADPRVDQTLQRYCRDDDPILREHAEWAVGRLAERREVAVS